jgi:hypothetical protein
MRLSIANRPHLLFATALIALGATAQTTEPGFTALFNGKNLTGWKAGANASTFTVQDGAIVTHGPTSHLFYMGDVHNHTFKDFELMVDIMTEPGSNGGVYIDTEYQESGFPKKGFEIQVNNTYRSDPRKTASIYEVKDNNDDIAPDNKWFTEDITVRGNRIIVKVDGKVIEDWTQPADWKGTKNFPDRKIAPGTIALQAHDPKSVVHYRNIRIKPLQ